MNDKIEKANTIKEEWSRKIKKWEISKGRKFIWRNKNSPYNILIAELLLKRTTATAADKIYRDFLEKYPDIKSLAEANQKDLEIILKPLGLYKQRSKQIKLAANYIMDNLDYKIPPDYDILIKVPGIGDYTASAIIVFAYGYKKAVIDSNVERILKRVFDIKENLLNNVSEILTPEVKPDVYNYGMIDLGSIICHYKYPKCEICPVNMFCSYYDLKRIKNIN